MTTLRADRPETSLTSQENDCVCPSFSLPVDPPSTITGPAVSSSVTVAERLSDAVAPTVSDADTEMVKVPRPYELKSKLPLAALDVPIVPPFFWIVTLTVLRFPSGSVTLQ